MVRSKKELEEPRINVIALVLAMFNRLPSSHDCKHNLQQSGRNTEIALWSLQQKYDSRMKKKNWDLIDYMNENRKGNIHLKVPHDIFYQELNVLQKFTSIG